MKRLWRAGPYALPALAAVVAACSNGGGGGTHGVSLQAVKRAPVSLSFRVPVSATASNARHASEIPAGTASLAVSVIGTGTSASATENVDATTCPPVNGEYVCSLSIDAPIGSDSFFADAYSGANETGTLLASASATYIIVANEANTVDLSLVPVATPTPSPSPAPSPSPSGVPFASVAVAVGTPGLVAGTAKTVPITVTALAANGSPVVGAYAFPITVSDTDTSGATVIQVNGSPSSTVTASSQNVTLAYTGLAINPFSISVSASNSTGAPLPASSPVPIYPQLTYPVITPVDASGYIEVPSGGSVVVTATEPGWLGAPYNQSISLTLNQCSYVTLTGPAPGSGTFTLSSTYPGINDNYCGIQFFGGPVYSDFTAVLLPVGATPAPSASPSSPPFL